MIQHLDERLLNDCVDDALAPTERAEVDAHLATCAACRDAVDRIQRLRRDLSSLPRDIAPPAHVLRSIHAQLDNAADAVDAVGARNAGDAVRATDATEAAHTAHAADAPHAAITAGATRTRGWHIRPRTLAAAAVLLIALSSGTTALLLSRRAEPGTAAAPGADIPSAPAARTLDTDPELLAVQAMERSYESAIVPLQRALGEQQTELSPETVRVLEANIAIIDRALAEAGAALRADPANVALAALVRSGYERKLDVLRSANAHVRARS